MTPPTFPVNDMYYARTFPLTRPPPPRKKSSNFAFLLLLGVAIFGAIYMRATWNKVYIRSVYGDMESTRYTPQGQSM